MITADLAELASAYGVATGYEDGGGVWHDVDPEVVVAVLAQLGVAPGDPAVPPVGVPTVVRRGARVDLGRGELLLEDGGVLPVDGVLGPETPLGWHRLRRDDGETPLAVTPESLARVRRSWGWMVQLYALRSPGSWGSAITPIFARSLWGRPGMGRARCW